MYRPELLVAPKPCTYGWNMGLSYAQNSHAAGQVFGQLKVLTVAAKSTNGSTCL